MRGALPRTPVTLEIARRARPFRRDDRLERGEPVPVVRVAEIAIARSLRGRDLRSQRLRPFFPAEKSAVMERERHRERLRFPRLPQPRLPLLPRPPRPGGA